MCTSCFQAIEPGHADIHQHDIRLMDGDQIQRRAAVIRLRDHLDLAQAGQQGPEAGPHQLMIIHKQNANRRHGRLLLACAGCSGSGGVSGNRT